MKHFARLRLSVVFLAPVVPVAVLAQAPPVPKLALPVPKSVPVASSSAAPSTDLLTEVRSRVSHLRSVPLPNGSQFLHENSAQKAVEEVKILHNWNGDPATAGWTFSFGKSGRAGKSK